MKEDELAMLARAGHPGAHGAHGAHGVGPPFPHPYLARLPMLDRRHPSAYSHGVGPPVPGGMWPGPDPYRDAAAAAAYRFDPMRGLGYNPLMALQEEERAKLYGQYPGAVGVGVGVGVGPVSHLRGKDPSPPGPGPVPVPGGMLNNHQYHHRPAPAGLPQGPPTGPAGPGVGTHPHKMTPTPPGGPPGGPPGPPMVVDLHKKEEPATQSR